MLRICNLRERAVYCGLKIQMYQLRPLGIGSRMHGGTLIELAEISFPSFSRKVPDTNNDGAR